MQPAQSSDLAKLLLPDEQALCVSPPPGIDAGAIRDALETAIRTLPRAGQPTFAQWRHKVLVEAGQILLARPGHLDDAIHLTRVASPALADTIALAQVRLTAMWKSGDRQGTIAEADRILGQPGHPPAARRRLRAALRRWNIEKQLTPRAADIADFWPDVEAALRDPLATVQPDGPYPLVERVGPKLCQLRGDGAQTEDVLARMRWGSEVHRRLVHVSRLRGAILARHETVAEDSTAMIADLYHAFQGRIQPPDLSAVRAALAAGTSVLIAQAHAGLSSIHNLGLPLADVPYSMVSVVDARATRPQDFHLDVRRPDTALGFAKLAQMMRRTPRVVRIFPDGPYGERRAVSVLGRKLEISRGAASLAFLGRAATFFCTSKWTGTGFVFTLTAGPAAGAHAGAEAFEQAFADFYADRLRDILLGPPEDMAPDGGFWSQLFS